ncbi:hypothetical protein HMPREF1548_06437 [Clostridium sp. KLE 1755]|nr:hypothetical protein HMPREF1548_06437 [Clostridium sp. KLE 1755]
MKRDLPEFPKITEKNRRKKRKRRPDTAGFLFGGTKWINIRY